MNDINRFRVESGVPSPDAGGSFESLKAKLKEEFLSLYSSHNYEAIADIAERLAQLQPAEEKDPSSLPTSEELLGAGKPKEQLIEELRRQLYPARAREEFNRLAILARRLQELTAAEKAGVKTGATAVAPAMERSVSPAAERTPEHGFADELRKEIKSSPENTKLLGIFCEYTNRLGLQGQDFAKQAQAVQAAVLEVGRNPNARVPNEILTSAKRLIPLMSTRGPMQFFLDRGVFPSNKREVQPFLDASGWREIEIKTGFVPNLAQVDVVRVEGSGSLHRIGEIIRPGFWRGAETIKAQVTVKLMS